MATSARVPARRRPAPLAVAAFLLALAGCAAQVLDEAASPTPPAAEEPGYTLVVDGEVWVPEPDPADPMVFTFPDGSTAKAPAGSLPPPEKFAIPQPIDDASAVTAAAYFVDTVSYAFATGDYTKMRGMYADACVRCAEVAAMAVMGQPGPGQENRGGASELTDARVDAHPDRPGDDAVRVVDAVWHLDPFFYVADGVLVNAGPAQVLAVRMTMHHDGRFWAVAELEIGAMD